MDFSDYIGFFISLLAILYLFLRRKREPGDQHSEHPQGDQKSQEDALKEFMRTMNIEVEDEQPKPRFKPRPKPAQQEKKPQTTQEKWRQHSLEERKLKSQIEERRMKTQIEERRMENAIEDRKLLSHLEHRYTDPFGEMHTGKNADAYEVIQQKYQGSRAQRLLERLPSKKEMLIMQEIIGPPKGMR